LHTKFKVCRDPNRFGAIGILPQKLGVTWPWPRPTWGEPPRIWWWNFASEN